MKKDHAKGTDEVDADEILPEYDFSRARPNNYASCFGVGNTARAGDGACSLEQRRPSSSNRDEEGATSSRNR